MSSPISLRQGWVNPNLLNGSPENIMSGDLFQPMKTTTRDKQGDAIIVTICERLASC
jgi:hypothetical protein